VSLRFVTTPLTEKVGWPVPRQGPPLGDLPSAIVPPAGDGGAGQSAWSRSLARLKAPETLVVTTGQQAGLFTGPLYTIYKAISSAVLAERLERRWSRPVVPVFWLAGDDHDFAEANHASWIGRDGAVVTHILRERPPESPLLPMYREPLGPEVTVALDALANDLPPSEFREQTLAWLTRHYVPNRSMAEAYSGALAELMAPFGILCLDSTRPEVKRAAAPHIVTALRRAAEIDAALDARAAELEAAGHDSGVSVGDGASLVMLEGKAGRDRLLRTSGGFTTRRSGQRFTVEELERIAGEEPGRLSPNVLLRPVVESTLLPTVAYVAGPAELRYFGLAEAVFRCLGVVQQRPVARWSGLVVEARVDRVLEKFGATLEELLSPGDALEARIARTQLPEEADAALQRLRETLEREYGILTTTASAIDPTIERPVQSALNQALAGTRDVEKRLIQHLKKRGETELSQVTKARALVRPLGKPQERVLTIAPLLARYGPGLLADLREAIGAWYDAALEGIALPA
jgi:bacillithiol biosynthesis cysteine-adding enzyme BshC